MTGGRKYTNSLLWVLVSYGCITHHLQLQWLKIKKQKNGAQVYVLARWFFWSKGAVLMLLRTVMGHLWADHGRAFSHAWDLSWEGKVKSALSLLTSSRLAWACSHGRSRALTKEKWVRPLGAQNGPTVISQSHIAKGLIEAISARNLQYNSSVLHALSVLRHFILITPLWDGHCVLPHFTDGDIEVRMD